VWVSFLPKHKEFFPFLLVVLSFTSQSAQELRRSLPPLPFFFSRVFSAWYTLLGGRSLPPPSAAFPPMTTPTCVRILLPSTGGIFDSRVRRKKTLVPESYSTLFSPDPLEHFMRRISLSPSIKVRVLFQPENLVGSLLLKHFPAGPPSQ